MIDDTSPKNSDESVESPNKVFLNILPIRSVIEEQLEENSDYFDS